MEKYKYNIVLLDKNGLLFGEGGGYFGYNYEEVKKIVLEKFQNIYYIEKYLIDENGLFIKRTDLYEVAKINDYKLCDYNIMAIYDFLGIDTK